MLNQVKLRVEIHDKLFWVEVRAKDSVVVLQHLIIVLR